MAKMSAFQAYGNKATSNSTKEPALKAGDEQRKPSEDFTVMLEDSTKISRGRPVSNKYKAVPKTYKLPEAVVDALEDKFYLERKTIQKSMTYSKYIANLIWADTHDGELLFDPVTGEQLRDLE